MCNLALGWPASFLFSGKINNIVVNFFRIFEIIIFFFAVDICELVHNVEVDHVTRA